MCSLLIGVTDAVARIFDGDSAEVGDVHVKGISNDRYDGADKEEHGGEKNEFVTEVRPDLR